MNVEARAVVGASPATGGKRPAERKPRQGREGGLPTAHQPVEGGSCAAADAEGRAGHKRKAAAGHGAQDERRRMPRLRDVPQTIEVVAERLRRWPPEAVEPPLRVWAPN